MSMVKKRFGRDTNTWKMFEHFFLDKDRTYPVKLGPYAKGKVINLVQGLNCCNVQWAEEQNMPGNMLSLSAKALKGDTLDSWFLEISTNYKRQGLASPTRQGQGSAWMLELIESNPGSNPAEEEGPKTIGGVVVEAEPDGPDPTDDILKQHGYF